MHWTNLCERQEVKVPLPGELPRSEHPVHLHTVQPWRYMRLSPGFTSSTEHGLVPLRCTSSSYLNRPENMSQILNSANNLLASMMFAAVVHRVCKFAVMLQTPNASGDEGLELKVLNKSETEYKTETLPLIVITPPPN